MDLLAIDLGKQSFHIHGITSEGEIISRKVSRVKFKDVVATLAPVTVAMEACASAHHWGRQFEALGCLKRAGHSGSPQSHAPSVTPHSAKIRMSDSMKSLYIIIH